MAGRRRFSAVAVALSLVALTHGQALPFPQPGATPETVRQYEDDGFAVFEDPARAVAAIAAMGKFGRAFARATLDSRKRMKIRRCGARMEAA